MPSLRVTVSYTIEADEGHHAPGAGPEEMARVEQNNLDRVSIIDDLSTASEYTVTVAPEGD